MKYLYLLLLVLSVSSAFSQEEKKGRRDRKRAEAAADTTKEDYFKGDFFRYDDHVYKPNIRTVKLHEQSLEVSAPVIRLGGDQKLELSFDDLAGDYKSYSYTFIHCDASWNPSDILPMEYIEGFMDDKIGYYRHSINTLQRYTHYRVSFPNDNMKITKPGNYVLKVYLDAPANVVLSRRFVVYDQKVSILAAVQPATVIEDRNYKQEVDLTIAHPDYEITNPYTDLKVVISQNGRWDNAVTGLKPLFVKDRELVYDFDRDNVFNAGSEYRYFDTRSIRYKTERVRKIASDDTLKQTHVHLVDDEKRTFKRYSSYNDINGRYIIKMNEAKYSEAEADYVNVHFFLAYNEPVEGGNLYVFGALSDWQCKTEFRLTYSKERGGYECMVPLKQGYYNYEYVFLKDGERGADNSLIEGMHYETENDYYIFVYYRQKGTFYEQPVGFQRVSSMKKF